MDAGTRGTDGHYPEGSVNHGVEDQLIAYAEARKRFSDHEESTGDK